MTQKQLILAYIQKHGSILPAKMSGELFEGQMIGSECIRRCQELRDAKILDSKRDGKFTRFFLKAPLLPPAFPKVALQQKLKLI